MSKTEVNPYQKKKEKIAEITTFQILALEKRGTQRTKNFCVIKILWCENFYGRKLLQKHTCPFVWSVILNVDIASISDLFYAVFV